jgi:RimJ/RimL family protein N-acetyltransferase
MYRWMLDPHVSRNIGLQRKPSLEYTRAWIERSGQAADVRAFAILQDGNHVGNGVLDRIDTESESARFSIYLGDPKARSCGIGRTALFMLLETGFLDLDLREVWLTVHPENQAALKIYAAAGFREEPATPAGPCSGDAPPGTIRMSVGRTDFEQCLRQTRGEQG